MARQAHESDARHVGSTRALSLTATARSDQESRCANRWWRTHGSAIGVSLARRRAPLAQVKCGREHKCDAREQSPVDGETAFSQLRVCCIHC
jgi:hypothetical protein